MSRFFSSKYASLEAYVPGEQPRDQKYIKLNTNESPFPPSPLAQRYAAEAAKNLQLYSDPECRSLIQAAVNAFGIGAEEIIFTNGSDDILNFAFMAFTDISNPALFADITYGFYPVFADLNGSRTEIVPLRDDFTLSVDDYIGRKGTVFIANPNAPTGISLPLSEIERLVASDSSRVVVIDEAYVDFGGESAVGLTKKYDNILVCQTFSKSRSFAGGRLGYGIGSEALISDLNTVKYSTNPYNINSMTSAMGIGILKDREYTATNCRTIMENRDYTVKALEAMGFRVLPSSANFIFVSSDKIDGGEYYRKLKEKKILVRHFDKPRISSWCRVSIGRRDQMEAFLKATEEILKEKV